MSTNLASTYATLIEHAGRADSGFAEKLIALMRTKGHLSILPQVIKILMRSSKKKGAVVTVAHESALKHFAHSIEDSLTLLGVAEKPDVVVDPKIVGGFTLLSSGKAVDNSFRSALVRLYRNTFHTT